MSRDNTIDDKEVRVVRRFDRANAKSDASRETEWITTSITGDEKTASTSRDGGERTAPMMPAEEAILGPELASESPERDVVIVRLTKSTDACV